MQNPFIIGFEGPCLAGKTTTITALKIKLMQCGYSVHCVSDYNKYAGGHKNFPKLFPINNKTAKLNMDFFIDLEKKRNQTIEYWLNNSYHGELKPIVLVDRLLVTCLAIRSKVNDQTGYETVLNAINSRDMIIPNITVFLKLNVNDEEYNRRLKTRIPFENWEIIYNFKEDYDYFFRYFNKEILNVNPIYFESSQVEDIFNYLINVINK